MTESTPTLVMHPCFTLMTMNVLADQTRVGELVDSMSRWTADRMDGGGDWALVGLKSRGDILAQRLAQSVGDQRLNERVGSLDITLYRDDLSEIGPSPVVRTTDIDFDIDGLNLVLVDDVLMTGRTIRAALASLNDLGRPSRIWLAVLVDRGGRELPICPDFAAWDLGDQAGNRKVKLTIRPTHERDQIVTLDDQIPDL